MGLTPHLKEKYLKQFEKLIADGETLIKHCQTIEKKPFPDMYGYKCKILREEHVDYSSFIKWRTDCNLLLTSLYSYSQIQNEFAATFLKLQTRTDNVRWGIETLRSIKENLHDGFLDDLASKISSEIAFDYMQQAENLIDEDSNGKYNHIPAAVLAGTVLEKTLRGLCDRQNPPVPTTKDNGTSKTLNPLIDDLKKAGLYNEAKAKHLKVYADIRNHAAHGKNTEFNLDDVKDMIRGIERFISEYNG